MTTSHINRVTGDQGEAAPLYRQDNGPSPLIANAIIGAPFSLIAQASNPHRLLFMQSVVVGLMIANNRYESLTLSTGLAMAAIVFGVWLLFYVPVLNIISKLAMSFIYGLLIYRLYFLIWTETPVTGQTFSIKYLATDVPISATPLIYGVSLAVVLVTLLMQRNRPLSEI